jgi:NAD(P)-dependent dehydrogenase (short-subunit alcohol dehydrogenase family)
LEVADSAAATDSCLATSAAVVAVADDVAVVGYTSYAGWAHGRHIAAAGAAVQAEQEMPLVGTDSLGHHKAAVAAVAEAADTRTRIVERLALAVEVVDHTALAGSSDVMAMVGDWATWVGRIDFAVVEAAVRYVAAALASTMESTGFV